MTKFLSFVQIDSISDHAFLGLSPDSESGSITQTPDQNRVLRVQLSNQKVLKSWTPDTPDQKLTHKVVYDFKSHKYVGVFEDRLGNAVCCWNENDVPNKKDKIKLVRSLQEIISFDDRHTILVYKDGACESLENFNRHTDGKPIVNQETHQIINIACFNTSDKHVMLTYFLRNKKTDAMEFVFFLLDDDNLTPTGNRHRIKIARKGLKLSGFTVVQGARCPSLMTIWSDERILMLPIRCDEPTPTDIGSLAVNFNELRVDKLLTIVNVTTNCVAIYGANTKQDGASLILYNTHHRYAQCKLHFKAYFTNCRLWVIGKHLFIADGKRLTCASFNISQEKLADLIGTKLSTDSWEIVRKEVDEETEFDCVRFNGGITIQTAAPTNTELATNGSAIQKGFNCPSEPIERFLKDLISLATFDIDIEIIRGYSLADVTKARTAVHPQDGQPTFEIIVRFLRECENNGMSETEITEHIIPIIIKANLPNELALCLQRYTNISEPMLAKSLKFFISMNESNEKLTFIRKIFACTFEEKLIKQHLRTNLNLDNAIYLLELIRKDLDVDGIPLDESPQYGQDFDSDTALINWFIVILDAHYQQFLLARDPTVNAMIDEWKELIDSFISGVRELKSVSAKLHNLVSGKATRNDNTGSKLYSVEWVKLY